MLFVGVKLPGLPLAFKKWATSILFDLFKGFCLIISIVIWDYCSKALWHISYDSRRGEDNFYHEDWFYWTLIHHTDTLYSIKVFTENRGGLVMEGKWNIFLFKKFIYLFEPLFFKGKSYLIAAPRISELVLAVAAVCCNNSLACQLLFHPQWETGKEAKSKRKCIQFASCLRSQRHLDVFLFLTLFCLEGLFGELHRGMLSLYCEVLPVYYQASSDLTPLNEVIDWTAGRQTSVPGN